MVRGTITAAVESPAAPRRRAMIPERAVTHATYVPGRSHASLCILVRLAHGPPMGKAGAMIEQFFDLTTADGDMPVFSVRPDGDGPYPVVVFLMDAPGMREELRDMCRRLASAGYYLIAPQLYYRKVREFNVFETEDRDTMFELMNSLSNTMVDGDVGDLLAHLAKDLATGTAVRHHDPAADTSRVGTVGYCMSGPFAITAAAAFPDQVKAAASIHGVRLATEFDDSPHRSLARSNAEVYIGCAETDHWGRPSSSPSSKRPWPSTAPGAESSGTRAPSTATRSRSGPAMTRRPRSNTGNASTTCSRRNIG
ncbi:MAG: dienelactone hydrolase family protein [Acidimicrobiales bacterium]